MDEAEFWALIDRSRVLGRGDVGEQVLELERLLTGRSVTDLQAFDAIYSALHRQAGREDLWRAGYVIDCGMSNDGFTYFRDWLISRGREVYELALANPDDLADVPDARPGEVDAETLAYAVYDAFEKTHGHEFTPGGADPIDVVLAAGDDDASFDSEELERRLPRLCAKFGPA